MRTDQKECRNIHSQDKPKRIHGKSRMDCIDSHIQSWERGCVIREDLMCCPYKRASEVGVSLRLKVLQRVIAHYRGWEVFSQMELNSHPLFVAVSAVFTHLIIPPASLWSKISLSTRRLIHAWFMNKWMSSVLLAGCFQRGVHCSISISF